MGEWGGGGWEIAVAVKLARGEGKSIVLEQVSGRESGHDAKRLQYWSNMRAAASAIQVAFVCLVAERRRRISKMPLMLRRPRVAGSGVEP